MSRLGNMEASMNGLRNKFDQLRAENQRLDSNQKTLMCLAIEEATEHDLKKSKDSEK